MLTQSLAETIRTVNTTFDTPADSAARDSGYEQISNGTKITFTDMILKSVLRNCSDAQTPIALLRERHTPGKTTSKDMYSDVKKLWQQRFSEKSRLDGCKGDMCAEAYEPSTEQDPCAALRGIPSVIGGLCWNQSQPHAP